MSSFDKLVLRQAQDDTGFGYTGAMEFGYQCEECEEAAWFATTRSELAWLRNRKHVVREVKKHLAGGLDSWMDEGLAFLDHHDGHSIVVVQRGGR